MKQVRRPLAFASLLFAALTFPFLSGCSPNAVQLPSVSGPIAGNPVFNGGQYSLDDFGYQKQEYFFSGIAAGHAPFTSRLVVIRPLDARRFNGTVVVEWLNVTSGVDQPAEWTYIHRELLREGYAYVGVSAQRVSIEGGQSYFRGGKPLKQVNPARYARLHHPGDAYSYDIFSQAGRLVRRNASSLLGPLKPVHLIAAGESQSAIFLTTYVNEVDPVAHAFDGFLIHSRLGFASGLSGALDGAPERHQPPFTPVPIRPDVRVPVLMTITETDVLAPPSTFLRVRQPDSNRIRTWEIAGTSHADNYVFGLGGMDSGSLPISQLAAGFRPVDTVAGKQLDVPINSAPQHHYVEEAAIHSLNRWLVSGVAPPSAPVLEVKDRKFVLDPNGNVRGGVRSPWVDVPTATLSGLGQTGTAIVSLVGTTRPFTPAQLHALYPHGKADYLAKFQASLQAAIRAGFILPADQSEIVALAAASYEGP